jgi:hypothetical protein
MDKNDKDENDRRIQLLYINKSQDIVEYKYKYIVVVLLMLFFVWYLFIEQVPGNNRIITDQKGGTRMDIGTICAVVFAFLVCSGVIIR